MDRGWRFVSGTTVFVLILCATTSNAVGSIGATDSSDSSGNRFYTCVERRADFLPEPPLPPDAMEHRRANPPPNPADCAKDKVAQPIAIDTEGVPPPSNADFVPQETDVDGRKVTDRSPPENLSGYTTDQCLLTPDTYYHCWVWEGQWYPNWQGTFALWGSQSQHAPINQAPYDGHSLSQLWATYEPVAGQESSHHSTIEMGWMVSNVYFGNNQPTQPHLFGSIWDYGSFGGLNDPNDFQSVTNQHYLGEAVTPGPSGVVHHYLIQLQGQGWWLYYDGYWLGYFPVSSFPVQFPPYLNLVKAGGENASLSHQPQQLQMGNGLYGSNPIGAWTGGWWQHLIRVRQPYSNPISEYVNPTVNTGVSPNHGFYSPPEWDCAYNNGNKNAQYGQFTYGGPGFASC